MNLDRESSGLIVEVFAEKQEIGILKGLLAEQLGLDPDDPVMGKFAAISHIFAGLKLPLFALPFQRQRELTPRQEGVAIKESPDSPPDFRLGVDYFFGRYQGRPRSVRENAAAAIYHGRQEVELWRILKSVAFTTLNNPLLIVHLRGDREIDIAELADLLHTNETDLARADIGQLDLKYGTVNPFITTTVPTRHIFDRDLVDGEDYPDDDIILTSSGDPRFYVGFDVRRYLTAISQVYPSWPIATSPVSKAEADSRRTVARRPIVIIGGDSGIDAARVGQTVMTAVIAKLEAAGQYYGDRSLPEIRLLSDPGLAGSIDTSLYSQVLRARITQTADELPKLFANSRHSPIVAFSSIAMHQTAGDILAQADGLEYVNPKEVVEQLLQSLTKRGVEITHTLLLGLPSVYDNERSAFVGDILDKALPVIDDLKKQIGDFVQACKTGEMDSMRFYQIIENILRKEIGDINSLNGRNVAVILGASELASFAGAYHKVPKTFATIKSGNPAAIPKEVAEAPDSKIRLVFISPSQASAEVIAQMTLTT